MNNIELVNEFAKYLENNLLLVLNDPRFLFLTQEISPFKIYKVISEDLDIEWFGDADFLKNKEPHRGYTHRYVQYFKLRGTIGIKDLETDESVEKEYSDELLLEASINGRITEISYDIYNHEKELLKQYNELIVRRSTRYGLIGFDDHSLQVEGENLLTFYSAIINKSRENSFAKDFNKSLVFDDLLNVTQDIRFTLGQVLTYKPYSTHYLADEMDFGDGKLFPYSPSLYDKRYFMAAGIVAELLYNYWDKIGDLIENCFGITRRRKVVFGFVIDRSQNQFLTSPHYHWLFQFRNNQYRELTNMRHRIVHQSALETDFLGSFLKKNTNKEELQILQKEKEEIADILIKQNKLLLAGFEHTMKLIDEIP